MKITRFEFGEAFINLTNNFARKKICKHPNVELFGGVTGQADILLVFQCRSVFPAISIVRTSRSLQLSGWKSRHWFLSLTGSALLTAKIEGRHLHLSFYQSHWNSSYDLQLRSEIFFTIATQFSHVVSGTKFNEVLVMSLFLLFIV